MCICWHYCHDFSWVYISACARLAVKWVLKRLVQWELRNVYFMYCTVLCCNWYILRLYINCINWYVCVGTNLHFSWKVAIITLLEIDTWISSFMPMTDTTSLAKYEIFEIPKMMLLEGISKFKLLFNLLDWLILINLKNLINPSLHQAMFSSNCLCV